MITTKDFHNALVTEFAGKEYNQYRIDIDVLKVLRGMLKAEDICEDNFWTNTDKQCVTIKYKQHAIGHIDVKKAKGAHHYRYGSSWNDWTYKEFEMHLYYDTIEQAIDEVETALVKARHDEEARKEQAIEVIKLIMEKTGKTSIYDVAHICDYISRNTYSLSDLI